MAEKPSYGELEQRFKELEKEPLNKSGPRKCCGRPRRSMEGFLKMPGMSGARILRHIREDRNLRDIPVIMVTAEAYRDYVTTAGESTIDAYILKLISVFRHHHKFF
jgi:DNA-binding NarL/FixJ family response regulator